METIPKANCVKIGFFRKTHGVHGEVVLDFEPQYEFSVEETTYFFVEIEGLLVPFFLKNDGFRFKNSNSAIVSFDDVETEKYARRLIGCSVYLFQSVIINPEEGSSGWMNFIVFDNNNNLIGKVVQVDDFAGNVVFTVDQKGTEILIPFNEDLLIEKNDSLKTVKLHLPDGLLEL